MRELTDFERKALDDPAVRYGYDNYELLVKVGDLLRTMRQESGLSQQELQAISGIHQSDISRAERGQGDRGPSLALVSRMAHASGYSVVLSLRKQGAASGDAMALTVEL